MDSGGSGRGAGLSRDGFVVESLAGNHGRPASRIDGYANPEYPRGSPGSHTHTNRAGHGGYH